MTGHDDFDDTLAGWFDADALTAAPADGLERALDATRRRRPRPAFVAHPGSRWIRETRVAGSGSSLRSFLRLGEDWSATLVLLLVIVALISGAILVGARLLHSLPLPAGRLGHLAYDLDGDVFVADWDGTNSVRIADGLPGDGMPTYLSPAWSPDGRHLAYRSWGSPTRGVFITDAAGGAAVSFPGGGWSVAWSPDSTRVATWVGERTVGVYGLDGARLALLTLPPGFGAYRDEDAVWSRDGTSLLISLRPDPGGDPRQTWELPIDGSAPRVVPAVDPWHFYSPDGTRVATAYPGLSVDSASLVVAKADGTQLRVLQGAALGPCNGPWASCGPQDGGVYEDPVWSPLGDRVAFTWSWSVAGSWYDKDGNPVPRPHELRIVDVASGTVTKLASDSEISAIAFSPEGNRILFRTTDADNVDAVWTVNEDGSDARLLVSGTNSADWQRLSADR